MNSVHRDIFRAIHEGKWLSIEYKNKEEKVTNYWIGIMNVNAAKGTLSVKGLHLGKYTIMQFDQIYIESICSSKIIEGSYFQVNEKLVEDIYLNPVKYQKWFRNIPNLKVLNYLEMCNRMDTTPYYSDFKLIHFIDRDSFNGKEYVLSQEQFQEVVKYFQKSSDVKEKDGTLHIQQLAINELSIDTTRGLYVLAYRKLNLDVERRVMRPAKDVTICTEYTIDGNRLKVYNYLDADEYGLLEDFEKNQELIKDCITRNNPNVLGVNDMPYIIGLGMDIVLDLHKEYQGVIDNYNSEKATVPIKAFFGELTKQPARRKSYPITLLDKNVNLDQLLAINKAMKYPVAYIQGPPGTGKTSTIINTIMTAFFNERSVLFVSYNNHPIDGVYEKLSQLEYRGRRIPFPILSIGNQDKMKKATQHMYEMYMQVQNVQIFAGTLDRNKDSRIERAKQLSELLKKYETILDLKERKETIQCLLEDEERRKVSVQMLPFQIDLHERQMQEIESAIQEQGEITNEKAISLIDGNEEDLKKYLYYTSARYIKKLGENKNKDLLEIISEKDPEKRAQAFTEYLSNTANVKKLQKIFPIIVTTCISAHKLGDPEPVFDMTIMDEASQCNAAVALVPIIRGEQLMLVGDPQQLSPVILLDDIVNQKLKRKYAVQKEYDYRRNSIYKVYLACDAVSDEILLHYHYRCHKKIVQFNNKKYYNNMLKIKTENSEKEPLVFVNVEDRPTNIRNTAPGEVEAIANYVANHKEEKIGIITPFVNQKNMIMEELKQRGIGENVSCGTVHAFQGDEKDIVLFSTAITNKTHSGTYNWLKNNKELINVATSRAKNKLIILTNEPCMEKLHKKEDTDDDLYELIQYVKHEGAYKVTPKTTSSRALGVKPFSTATEEAFLTNLNHALENIWLSQSKYVVKKEVGIAHVFQNNDSYNGLFYNGRFDFVVYERVGGMELPVLAIELDGKEHFDDMRVKERDRKKNEICKEHNLQLIRVENSYARRYNYIKDILINYFSVRH